MIVGSEALVVGELGNICVVVWRGAVTQERFDQQRTALASVVKRHPGTAGFVCIIEASAPPPSDAMRRASANMIREHQGGLSGIACVVEGTGFVAALTRSALSAIALLVGSRRAPLHITANVEQGIEWLAPRVNQPDAAALTRAITTLRAS